MTPFRIEYARSEQHGADRLLEHLAWGCSETSNLAVVPWYRQHHVAILVRNGDGFGASGSHCMQHQSGHVVPIACAWQSHIQTTHDYRGTHTPAPSRGDMSGIPALSCRTSREHALAALQKGRDVECMGLAGMGKTTLLRMAVELPSGS